MSSGSDVSYDSDSEEETLITVSPRSGSQQHGGKHSSEIADATGIHIHETGNGLHNSSASSHPIPFNQVYNTMEFCAMTGRNQGQHSAPSGTSTPRGKEGRRSIQQEDFVSGGVKSLPSQFQLQSGARSKVNYANNERKGTSPMTQSNNSFVFPSNHHSRSVSQEKRRGFSSEKSHATGVPLNSYKTGNALLNPNAPSYSTPFNQVQTGAGKIHGQQLAPAGTSMTYGKGGQKRLRQEHFVCEGATGLPSGFQSQSGARPKENYTTNHRDDILHIAQSSMRYEQSYDYHEDFQRMNQHRGELSFSLKPTYNNQQQTSYSLYGAHSNSSSNIDNIGNRTTPRSLGYKKLEEWSKITNELILVFEMSTNTERLTVLLSQNQLPPDWIHLLILILKKTLGAQSQKASLKTVLECVCKSTFFDTHLPFFFDEMHKKRKISPDVYGCVQKIVDVVEYIIINLGVHNVKCNQCLRVLSEKWALLNVLTEGSNLALRINKLLDMSRSFQVPLWQTQIRRPHLHKSRRIKAIPVPDEAEPPDDYSTMKIFPDTAELETSVEPFLRANKTTGPYRDLQHYLDVQTRLLKEDYLDPIRTGLQEYKTALKNGRHAKEDNLRFYYNVSLATMKCDANNGILHFVLFDTSELGNIEWQFSRRLMFGSLLVLSKDNFETTIFATVANRDVPKLERGVVEVEFQSNLEEVFTSAERDTFVMAETTAYFESYRHVLEGLLEMRKIPLERYIVSCSEDVRYPQYLQRDSEYNICSIMNKPESNCEVPVLDPASWPDSKSTSLNESQLEAVKLALCNEMAIIQGPPGTGKTYVGLKIMKILLGNKTNQRSMGKPTRGPILVVCFTNHALDQFLEGMLEFCNDGIVRVGGRSSSELLQAFNLKTLRQNRHLARKIRNNIRYNIKMCKRNLRQISRYVEKYWQESMRLETTILNVDDLDDEMSETHRRSLTDPSRCRGIDTHIMSTWLKASNANMERHLGEAAKRHLAKVIAKGGDTLSDVDLKQKCEFQTRVKIYNFWLMKFRSEIEFETSSLLENGNEKDQERVNQLLTDLEATKTDILSDLVLKPYMSEKAYNTVVECVKEENKTMDLDNNYIRQWLLKVCETTDKTLDAIEHLIKVNDDKRQSYVRGKSVDDEVKTYEDRWVIDDSDSDDSDMGFDGSDDDSDRERNDMEDLDDGGMVQISDVTELEESFKQFKLKEISMLQRAKMLGIDLSETSSESSWETVSNMSYSKVFQLYHNALALSDEQAEQIDDVWSLQIRDRYRLYKYWVQNRKSKLTERLIALTQEYRLILQQKKEVQSLRDIEILKRAKVIGMTTTGAAKHRSVLQAVGCRIIVVEEAAEVLEAHIVTTLNQKCQHLILIGDHQQLRPSPTVHKLAVDYGLEISLFERLVKNNIPHVTLTKQHRMRPEISEYVKHIYPHLEDHPSVKLYDDIRGVQSNIFFLQHNFEESAVEDSTSKCNQHEAKFLTKLCKYFLQHGYMGKQITILAAYGGQVKAIRQEMEIEESTYEYVRVTSIDNYQGEENDIILLSLVRSNAENDVGFLKTDNRVCVALSRAKKGLYVIGNLQLLASKSYLWKNIVVSASKNNVTGVTLKLVCVNHSHHITHVHNPSDFETEVPEGGCKKPCDYILPCGHSCTRMCHASDRLHQEAICKQPCTKTCSFGHPCQKDCHEECGVCEVRVDKEIPLCGHTDQVACYQEVDEVLCSQHCGLNLPCGHKCHGQCGRCMQDSHQPCLEKVDKTWPCGHTNKTECHTDTSLKPCPEKCKQRLECGHKCKGTCGGCLLGRVHEACGESCKEILPCGHSCKGPCGVQCVPCEYRCPTACRHRICPKKCGELCEPCTENCSMTCKHKKCDRLCMDECLDTIPCSKMCGLPVPMCKHKCSSLCGEPCVCYGCEKGNFSVIDFSKKNKPQYAVAHDKRERAKKIDLGEDTVIMKIPKCKHIFTLKHLDRYVENFEPQTTSFVRCPICTASLHGISRYETQNKIREEKRENKKKDLIMSAKVSEDKIDSLIDSKKLIDFFCIVDKAEFLTGKPDQIDANHAHALTMQIRFAFALSKIYKIHRNFNEETEFNISKWKCRVTSIKKVLTPQLLKELTMELHRLLILEQVSILSRYAKDTGIKLTDDLKTAYRAVLKEGSKEKLTPENKKSYQVTVQALYRIFDGLDDSFEHWCVNARKLKEKVDKVIRYLDRPVTEDLVTILDSM